MDALWESLLHRCCFGHILYYCIASNDPWDDAYDGMMMGWLVGLCHPFCLHGIDIFGFNNTLLILFFCFCKFGDSIGFGIKAVFVDSWFEVCKHSSQFHKISLRGGEGQL